MAADGDRPYGDDPSKGDWPANQQFQIIAVHGTNANDGRSRGAQWWQRGSDFSSAVLALLDTRERRVVWVPYKWDGGNRESIRSVAGMKLGKDLRHRRPELPARIALIGHSHGGNVCTEALLEQDDGDLDSISTICVGTPVLRRSFFVADAILAFFKFALLGFLLLVVWQLLASSMGWRALNADSLQRALFLAGGVASYVLFANLPVFGPVLARLHGLLASVIGGLGKFGRGVGAKLPRKHAVSVIRLYSEKDEAINSLMGMARKEWRLASTAMTRPFFIFSVTAICVAFLWLVQYRIDLPMVSAFRNFAENMGALLRCTETASSGYGPYCEVLAGVNLYMPIALAASVVVAIIASRLGGAWLLASAVNMLFRFIILNGAFGMGSRVFTRWAAAPNPDYLQDGEIWKPLPVEFDVRAADAVNKHAAATLAAARDDVGVVAVMPSRNFLDAIRSNIGWNEVFHNVYFDDPNFQQFVAYVLVEKCGFPCSALYREIARVRREEFESWFQQIAPSDYDGRTAKSSTAVASSLSIDSVPNT